MTHSVGAAFKFRLDCGTNMAVKPRTPRKPPVPIDTETLNRLALDYVGRYATTRAKLRAYLARKLRERGWAGEGEAPVTALAERFAELGYIDDRAFAEGKGAALTRRGYGARRVATTLRAAGISEEDGRTANDAAAEQAWEAALAFARRKRIGPFAREQAEADRETLEKGRRKAFDALLRGGHSMEIARRILAAEPDQVLTDPF